MTTRKIDILKTVEEQKLGRFQITVAVLLFAVMLADGYDVQNIGFAAQSLIRVWHMPKSELGPIFGSGLFGLMVGALICGPLGDRLGRKRVIVGSALFLGLVNLVTMTATSPSSLIIYRFLAGFGIGGVMPNAIALITEYSPKRVQATSVWVVMTGYAVGAASGGLISTTLVPHFGWQVLFFVGGTAPIVITVFLVLFLPESVRFLALHRAGRERVLDLIARMSGKPVIDSTAEFYLQEKHAAGGSIKGLFSEGRAGMTIMLWFAFAGTLMTLQFLLTWTPTVLASASITPAEAAIATSCIPIGGIVGGFVISRLIDRRGLVANAILFACGAVIVGLTGLGHHWAVLAMIITFCSGFCVVGGQTSLNVVASRIYPTSMRAHGVGWANAIGRLGSISGPVVGGVLISWNLDIGQLFYFAAVPVGCAAIACFLLARLESRRPPAIQEAMVPSATQQRG
jgi:AAHS family 4-hydroxybenzoate transporter-like MFS transporter